MRSRKGASITFGLLLFLVCAILCSVILVAATTASGRVAGMAEMDQRYYCVTSAAELLRDMIKDKKVVVVREETFKKASPEDTSATVPVDDKTTFYMGDASSTTEALTVDAYKYGEILTEYDDGEIQDPVMNNNKINQSFLTDAALRSVETSVVKSGTDSYYQSGINSASRTFTMKVPDKDPLTAIVTEAINPAGDLAEPGTILFTIRNADTTDGTIKETKDRYQMTLTFKADRSSTSSDTDTKKTTTTTLTWNLQSIQ